MLGRNKYKLYKNKINHEGLKKYIVKNTVYYQQDGKIELELNTDEVMKFIVNNYTNIPYSSNILSTTDKKIKKVLFKIEVLIKVEFKKLAKEINSTYQEMLKNINKSNKMLTKINN